MDKKLSAAQKKVLAALLDGAVIEYRHVINEYAYLRYYPQFDPLKLSTFHVLLNRGLLKALVVESYFATYSFSDAGREAMK